MKLPLTFLKNDIYVSDDIWSPKKEILIQSDEGGGPKIGSKSWWVIELVFHLLCRMLQASQMQGTLPQTVLPRVCSQCQI